MRFSTKRALLALVAVFAMSAIVVSAAAAATKPEFKPVPTKKKFTVSGVGSSTWHASGTVIVCTKSSATGEIDSAETVGNVVIVYSGCKEQAGAGVECPANSVGAKEGEIVTKALAGELGTVATSEASSGVGLLLGQTSPKKIKWFEFQGNNCTVEAAFSGDLAAEVTGISVKQATRKLVFQPASDGVGEKIKKITLDSGISQETELEEFGKIISIETQDELTFEEPVEIT